MVADIENEHLIYISVDIIKVYLVQVKVARLISDYFRCSL